MFLKLFHKREEKGILLFSFYKTSITLIPKADKYHQNRKFQTNFPDEL